MSQSDAQNLLDENYPKKFTIKEVSDILKVTLTSAGGNLNKLYKWGFINRSLRKEDDRILYWGKNNGN